MEGFQKEGSTGRFPQGFHCKQGSPLKPICAGTPLPHHRAIELKLTAAVFFFFYILLILLFENLHFSPDFTDKDRLTTLIRMSASDLAASVPQAGHNYAMAYAASTLSPAAALNELFGGMTQVLVRRKCLIEESHRYFCTGITSL